MKKILPFYLYPPLFKTIGLIMSIIGLILYLFLNNDFQLLFYFGLILILFSKESKESETIVKIRAESFKTIFGYLMAYILVLFLMTVLYSDMSFPANPFLLMGLPMLLYVLYFNLLLLVNRNNMEGEDKKATTGNSLWLAFAVLSGLAFALKLLV